VELVDEGRTGHVANHPQPFAEAVAALLDDDGRRAAFGNAARGKVDRLFDVVPLTRQLERLYAALVAGESLPEWSPSPAEVDTFAAEYAHRATAQFRPLTGRERLEARASVFAERARWAAHDLRRHPGELGRAVAARLTRWRRRAAA
jgi:hypothetical protein